MGKKESTTGLKIGDYWDEYNSVDKSVSMTKYWGMIDMVCEELKHGKLYKAENVTRRLLCNILYYLNCKKQMVVLSLFPL